MGIKNNKMNQGMVDISEKDVTKRIAAAYGQIKMSRQAFQALVDRRSPKGDVLDTAKIAGIMAAKSTPAIIPMCHPLELNKVSVELQPDKRSSSVKIHSEVVCFGRTGVEMEALTAVAASALTVYDMMKWADKAMVISDIKLLRKSGGKSGEFRRSS